MGYEFGKRGKEEKFSTALGGIMNQKRSEAAELAGLAQPITHNL